VSNFIQIRLGMGPSHGVSAKSPRIIDRSGSVRVWRVIGALGRPKGRAEREREPVLKEELLDME
jgi:hypothetical protein